MLRRLSVENYALIERLDLELGAGLNIITGETGAGKSILLGALGLLLGNRGDATTIKESDKNCVVEGTFDISGYDIKAFFEENDLDYDNSVIVRRMINPAGKSRAFINELPVQLTTLREFGLRLIDIHSQHQSLMLSDEAFRTNILDSVASHGDLLSQYHTSFDSLKSKERQLTELISQAEQSSRDQEYLMFQCEQLSAAALKENEQQELEAELAELSNANMIIESLGGVHDALEGDDTGVLTQLKAAEAALTKISDVYARGNEFSQSLHSALAELKELNRELASELDRIEADPTRLGTVEQRLDTIYSLQQKHKVSSIEELIALEREYSDRLRLITAGDENIGKLRIEIEKAKTAATELARKISRNRIAAGKTVKEHIENILSELGMANAAITVEVTTGDDLRATGCDSIRFLFASGAGMTAQPVEKVASGGEVSRIMLGVKSLVAKRLKLPTIIFDEIDTGVSGRIADSMGDIISAMAESMQVVNITHLPQVASKGTNHYVVYKDTLNGRPTTHIKRLNAQERIDEIAKMLSGTTITEAAISQAKLLLKA